MKRTIIYVYLLLMAISYYSKSELPCDSIWTPVCYKYSYGVQDPPLSIGMPFDVILGYIALDSVVMHHTRDEVLDIFRQAEYNDTMKIAMKHLYKMIDYNPLIFNSSMYSYKANSKSRFSDIVHHGTRTMFYSVEDSLKNITAQLLKSSYILKVRVIDTVRTTFDQEFSAMNVLCNVLDTIKGKVLPNSSDYCNFTPTSSSIDDNSGSGSIPPPPTWNFAFMYGSNWEAGGSEYYYGAGTPFEVNGKSPLMKNKDYIVFLESRLVCFDTTHFYFDLSPHQSYSSQCSIYLVEDGYVINPNNDFGFGTNPTEAEFIQKLEEAINEIINY